MDILDDKGNEIALVLNSSEEGIVPTPRGWVSFWPVSETKIEDETLPFHRGTMIQIVKSPSPDKVPDGSVAMLIDYNRMVYTVKEALFQGNSSIPDAKAGFSREEVQYNMKVLYDEKVVELFNAKPEEFGSNYIGVTRETREEDRRLSEEDDGEPG